MNMPSSAGRLYQIGELCIRAQTFPAFSYCGVLVRCIGILRQRYTIWGTWSRCSKIREKMNIIVIDRRRAFGQRVSELRSAISNVNDELFWMKGTLPFSDIANRFTRRVQNRQDTSHGGIVYFIHTASQDVFNPALKRTVIFRIIDICGKCRDDRRSCWTGARASKGTLRSMPTHQRGDSR
jgi:hypothetical protein